MARHPFDFHGRLGFVLETDDAEAEAFFEAEYCAARGEPAPETPLVHLTWRWSPTPCLSARRGHLHTHKLFARWRYALRLSADQVALEAVGNRAALSMVHHMMVHPSLRYLASLRGMLLLHGAAVALGGRSLVLTGPGGMGKTTMSALLLAHGGPDWQLHADDYVFLTDGPRTLAYLTRSHLYRGLLDWLPDLAPRLTRGERLRLEVLGRIRAWTRESIKWPVRLPQARLWPGRAVAQQADLAAITVLRKGFGSHPSLTPIPRRERPLTELLEMNFFEARHFHFLVDRARSSGADLGWLASWREREGRVLEARADDTPFYWLDIPTGARPESTMGQELLDLVEPILRPSGG